MKKMVRLGVGLLMLGWAVTGIAQDSAADVYKTNCAPCHGVTGDANTPAGKNFKATVFNTADGLKKSDADLVKFTKVGKDNMPAWADVLTDKQIKDVIAYIRTLSKK